MTGGLFVHMVDVVHWFLDINKPVSAVALGGIYQYDDGRELHYRVTEGRIGKMELFQGSHVVERVELEMTGDERYPVQATYRNMAAFRELKLTRESVQRVEPFPPDIWYVIR